MQARIEWVRPPTQMIAAIKAYGQRVITAVYAIALHEGVEMQNDARQNAIWVDRTGNARSGLFFAVDGFGEETIIGEVTPEARGLKTDTAQISGSKDALVIVLGHTVWYGKWLELANGGRYAVVMSTVQAHLPRLENKLHEVLS